MIVCDASKETHHLKNTHSKSNGKNSISVWPTFWNTIFKDPYRSHHQRLLKRLRLPHVNSVMRSSADY